MRIGKRGFADRIKGNLRLTFDEEALTSFAGLELVRRYVRKTGLSARLWRFDRRTRLGGDIRGSACILVVVAMLLVGARRLRHVRFLEHDPIVRRFCGATRLPSSRSLGRVLAKMNYRVWPELDDLNLYAFRTSVAPLRLHRATIDIDGTVITTGLTVERAMRGYNPHFRKNPSYYPILATLAQTGHVVAHQNRSGNVHDSHGAAAFLRRAVRAVREQLDTVRTIEVRVDSAFFQRDFFRALDALKVQYAVKVPMWPWLNLRSVVAEFRPNEWKVIDHRLGVQALWAELPIKSWGRVERIAIYRKRVGHKPVKGTQLDLFNPDDGHWEYSVVATNKDLSLLATWHFANGRGIQEKTIAELKTGYALDAVTSRRYTANTAWQKLNVFAHNLATSLQLDTGAAKKSRSLRRTTSYLIRSIRSLRFEWLNRAARLLRPAGRPTMRLADNPAVQAQFVRIEHFLDRAA